MKNNELRKMLMESLTDEMKFRDAILGLLTQRGAAMKKIIARIEELDKENGTEK